MATTQDTSAVREAAMAYLKKRGLPANGGNLSRAMEFLSKADTPLKSLGRPVEEKKAKTAKKTTKTSKSGKDTSKSQAAADALPIPGKKPAQSAADDIAPDDGAETGDYYRGFSDLSDGENQGPYDGGVSSMPGAMEGGGVIAALLARAMMRSKGGGDAQAPGSRPNDAGWRGYSEDMPLEGELMPPERFDQVMGMPDQQRIPFTMDARQVPGGNALGYDAVTDIADMEDDPRMNKYHAALTDNSGRGYNQSMADSFIEDDYDPDVDRFGQSPGDVADYDMGEPAAYPPSRSYPDTQGGPFPTQQQPMQQIPYNPSSPVAQGGPFPMGMQPGQNDLLAVLKARAEQEAMSSGAPRSQVPVDDMIGGGGGVDPAAAESEKLKLLRAFLGALGGHR